MISFFVPAYNEEANLSATIDTILSASRAEGIDPIQIIVVDDGSTDATHKIVDEMAYRYSCISLLTNQTNSGLGVSLRRALKNARYPYFTVVPGDNDLSETMIRNLISHHNKADLIMAFPVNLELRSRTRNLLSILFRMFYLVVFKVLIHYVNAPSIYATERLRHLKLHAKRFSIIAEINVKLLRSGCSYAEIPSYLQNPVQVDRTVSSRNLWEVVASFIRLFIEVNILERSNFDRQPHRVML